MGWRAEHAKSSHELRFTDAAGHPVHVELREREGQPINEIALTSGDVEFCVAYAKCGDLLEISRGKAGERRNPQLMPAGKGDPVGLVTEELLRGGPHRIYLRAFHCVRDLL